jgi:hypothetical protein
MPPLLRSDMALFAAMFCISFAVVPSETAEPQLASLVRLNGICVWFLWAASLQLLG